MSTTADDVYTGAVSIVPVSSRRLIVSLIAALLAVMPGPGAGAQRERGLGSGLGIERFELANGMRFVLVQRPDAATVAAGWAVGVGSRLETTGQSGVSHLLEHLLFKGTGTIGVRDRSAEIELVRRQDELEARLVPLVRRQWERYRAGEIGDPDDRETMPRSMRRLRDQLAELEARRRGTLRLGELSLLYSQGGSSDLDAVTFEDLTLFYVTLPADRLELWFWLESDRLLDPVVRELAKEKRVVAEERRLRLERPGAAIDLELEAAFWGEHAYARIVLGDPADVEALTSREVGEWLRSRYVPGSLTAVLVGRFDSAEVRRLAKKYFGRLVARPGPRTVPAVPAPLDHERIVDRRCDCGPRTRVLYRTVPIGHPDAAALEVVVGALNGRSGRLYRSLVLEREVAFSAYALHRPLAVAGDLSVEIEGKGVGTTPETLLGAWDAELARLLKDGLTEAELEKVKNQVAADVYRRVRDPAALAKQLLIYDRLGDPRYLETWAVRIDEVPVESVLEVARRYLATDERAIGFYRRAEAGAVH